MIYLGSKERIFTEYSNIVLNGILKDAKCYIEPFGGGMNCITRVPYINSIRRIAVDHDPFIIALWQGLQQGLTPPKEIFTEEKYKTLRNTSIRVMNKKQNWRCFEIESMFEIACARFLMSYAGKPFGGYVGGEKYKRDYYKEACKNLERHVLSANNLNTIQFICEDYYIAMDTDLKCIFYCDPPRRNTTGLHNGLGVFNYELFWDWARRLRAIGHYVYVSEYTAPSDWTCVWEKETTTGLQKTCDKDILIERLFV